MDDDPFLFKGLPSTLMNYYSSVQVLLSLSAPSLFG